MKKAATFKLSPQTTSILTKLADEMKSNKTQVLERAVDEFANKKGHKNELLKFAGCIGSDMDDILIDIKTSRKNKKSINI